MGAGIREYGGRGDRVGARITELDFEILDGVTAEQRDPRLAEFVEAAAENGADRFRFEAFFRKCCDRQRRQRPAAHRIDVADGIGGGDLAVAVWVVDNRREKIDGLDERRAALPPVHTRIVRGPEVDQDTVVGGRGNVTQHLSELACGEFARSTSAGNHLRQTHGHWLLSWRRSSGSGRSWTSRPTRPRDP